MSRVISESAVFLAVARALEESVKRNMGDGLLLSGGLDTAILAHLASRWARPTCVTVAWRGAPAPDIEYARLAASHLGLKHHVHYFDNDELDGGIRAVIKIIKTFDPMEVRNSAAIHIALRKGKELGLSAIMTGDGADELFAGYSYFFDLSTEELDRALKKLWPGMSFSAVPLARGLGLEVRLPYLDPQFKDLAMSLDASLRVRSEWGQVWGKWVLRRAFEGVMPPELIWRAKAPVEVGTGTTTLPSFFESRISDAEFEQKRARHLREDRVSLRSKEHLHYYEIYRREVGVPQAVGSGPRNCPGCQAKVEAEASFCRTCGAYPI